MRIEDIKRDIASKCVKAVADAQDQIAEIVESVLQEYYASYSPERYERTYQLLQSCVKSSVVRTGNGATAEVYLDSGMMAYTSGSQPSGAQVMGAANAGVHGAAGLKTVGGGPPLSDTAEQYVDRQVMNILLEAIRAAGIPVR